MVVLYRERSTKCDPEGDGSKMKSEEINREALIAAVETELPEVEHFLDLRTGEVLTIVGPVWSRERDEDALDAIARDNRELARQVRAEPERYELVPGITPEAGFRWMQEFASTVADEGLRGRLQAALGECSDDCFQSFRSRLLDAPEAERERWFAFRNEKLNEFIDSWLEGRGEI
ncbi:MAG TPA: UPF0158 family protein [Pyrinomonadaceae bacterium]|jgi:hypothetical protein